MDKCGFVEVAGFPGYWVNKCGEVRSQHRLGQNSRIEPTIWRKLKPGPVSKHGYLSVCLVTRSRPRPKTMLVHRLVLTAFVGPCPEGMECLHGDDDPSNNNLDNLRWGTPAENSADMVRRGRTYTGRRTYLEKLTEDDIPKIRGLRIAGMSCRAIGGKFGVHMSTIDSVIQGRTWSHVACDAKQQAAIDIVRRVGRAKGPSQWNSKLIEEDIPEIRRLVKTGVTQVRVAGMFGVRVSTINAVTTGQSWSHIT